MRRLLPLLCAFILGAAPLLAMAQATESPPAAPVPEAAAVTSPKAEATPEPTPTPEIPVPAATEPPPSNEHIFSAGLGYRTTNWSHFESPSNTNVTYNVSTATNTIVDGDFAIPKTGLRVGFSATPDGGVGNASRYLGYFGFKGFSLRTETGSFSGSANFSGSIAPGESREVDFQQVYHYTELDYTFLLNGELPWFIGLRYTAWNLPAEVALLSANQSSGPTILDPGFQSSFYSILSGFDFFKDQILIAGQKPSTGFGVMGSFVVGIGVGSGSVSDATAKNVQSIYSKTLSTQTLDVFTVHLSGQLGPKYTFEWKGFSGVVGIGYDINLLDLIASQTGGGSSTPTTKLDPVAYPNFIYQGWILRTMASF